MDRDILARTAHTVRVDQDRRKEQERRNCFYCLEGWIFLGSLGYDGEEVFEAVRCRRCGCTGQLA